jgi:membrane-anchored glycerophosphoryl diester phosphodiesterase (GDPDase)
MPFHNDVDPLQYLSFGATFSRTISIFFDRYDLFLVLSAIVLVPFCITLITVTIFVNSLVRRKDTIPDFHPKHLPLIGGIVALQLLLYAVITIVGRGAMIRAVAEMYLGDRSHAAEVNWRKCFKKSLEQFWSLLGASIMVAGMMILLMILPISFHTMGTFYEGLGLTFYEGLFMLILAYIVLLASVIAAVYIFISLVMSSPAIIIEQRTTLEGLQRSWELSSGSRCYIMCTLFLLWFLNQLVGQLLSYMFMSGDSDVMNVLFEMKGILLTVLPMLVFFPLHAM